MHTPPLPLHPGQDITLTLVSGIVVRGTVKALRPGWLHLRTDTDGAPHAVFVQLAHVATIAFPPGSELTTPDVVSTSGLQKPQAVSMGADGQAPGRRWAEDELRDLADAFLDGARDNDLATRFHRPRGVITELHRAFECARGNLVEDQISPVAQTWVQRWRKVLTKK